MNPKIKTDVLAAALGIIGAFMMATMVNPALAFGVFLASNMGWLVFSARQSQWPLFWQQAIFLVSSLLGLWNWWLGPLVLG